MTMRRLTAIPWGTNAPAQEILPGGVSVPVVEIDDATGIVYVGGIAQAGGGGSGSVLLAPTADQIISGGHQLTIALTNYSGGTDATFAFNGPNDILELHQPHSIGASFFNHSHTTIWNYFDSRGTQASPTASGLNDEPVEVRFGGYDGSAYAIGAAIVPIHTENWTTSAHGMKLIFRSVVAGATANSVPLTLNGTFVGINNQNPLFSFQMEAGGNAALGAPASAPTDGNLLNGQISFYLDEAGNNLKVRVKYSNGTLKTATIALV